MLLDFVFIAKSQWVRRAFILDHLGVVLGRSSFAFSCILGSLWVPRALLSEAKVRVNMYATSYQLVSHLGVTLGSSSFQL